MTIINPLSPARTQAFHTTQSTQRKPGGPVQFSLPPVADKTAPAGSSAGAPGPVRPAGVSPLPPITSLPIATPVGAIGSLGLTGATTPAPTAGTPPNPGNAVTARLISRLYQQPG